MPEKTKQFKRKKKQISRKKNVCSYIMKGIEYKEKGAASHEKYFSPTYADSGTAGSNIYGWAQPDYSAAGNGIRM
jgi:hypothetical protein